MIKAIAEGIPADVTVRLKKVPVTVTARDAIFLTFVDAFFAFSVRSDQNSHHRQRQGYPYESDPFPRRQPEVLFGRF